MRFAVLDKVERFGRQVSGRVAAMAPTDAAARAWSRKHPGTLVARLPEHVPVRLGGSVLALVDDAPRANPSRPKRAKKSAKRAARKAAKRSSRRTPKKNPAKPRARYTGPRHYTETQRRAWMDARRRFPEAYVVPGVGWSGPGWEGMEAAQRAIDAMGTRRNPSAPRSGEPLRRFEQLAEEQPSEPSSIRVVRIRPKNRKGIAPGLYAGLVVRGAVERWHGPYASVDELKRGLVRLDEVGRALSACGGSSRSSGPSSSRRPKATPKPRKPRAARLPRAAYKEAAAVRAGLPEDEQRPFDRTWRGLFPEKGRATLAEAWQEWAESHPDELVQLQIEAASESERRMMREIDAEYARAEREAMARGDAGADDFPFGSAA